MLELRCHVDAAMLPYASADAFAPFSPRRCVPGMMLADDFFDYAAATRVAARCLPLRLRHKSHVSHTTHYFLPRRRHTAKY